MANLKTPTGILARWLETLAEYQFKVIHRSGKLHTNADALSRLPIESKVIEENGIPLQEVVRNNILFARIHCNGTEISNQQIIDAQQADSELRPVLTIIQDNMSPDKNKIRQYSRSTRFYIGTLGLKCNLAIFITSLQ